MHGGHARSRPKGFIEFFQLNLAFGVSLVFGLSIESTYHFILRAYRHFWEEVYRCVGNPTYSKPFECRIGLCRSQMHFQHVCTCLSTFSNVISGMLEIHWDANPDRRIRPVTILATAAVRRDHRIGHDLFHPLSRLVPIWVWRWFQVT